MKALDAVVVGRASLLQTTDFTQYLYSNVFLSLVSTSGQRRRALGGHPVEPLCSLQRQYRLSVPEHLLQARPELQYVYAVNTTEVGISYGYGARAY